MKRDVIETILSRAPGIEASKDRYQVGKDHHVSFYIGDPGHAMVIGDIDRITLEEEFAELSTRETGTSLYVAYDAIQLVAVRPPKDNQGRRAGFA